MSTTPALDAPATATATATAATLPAFDSLGLPPELERAVADLGFTTPTAIQARAIPALLDGRDITGVAQTGTGKTAAFGLPLLAAVEVDNRHVQALVLTPTRELAIQVSDAIESFAATLPGLRVLAVYGGSPYVPQQRALRDGVHVVVGTPGRVMDHLDRGALVLDDIKYLVLDEADEMLRMGFAEDVEQIFSKAPTQRQVALFSATMPPAIRAVADTHLNDPVEVAVSRQSSTVTSVHQTYAVVPFRHKVGALTRILATSDADATIVFTRTRSAAEEVGAALIEKGISAATISGDVAQKEREKIVERLRSGALDVLVATDVAARGLDVDRVGLVVNFDIPREPEAYVHRIGRTGRAVSFITPHERGKLKHIEHTIKSKLEELDIPSPRDVSEHRAKRLLETVPARREAGRLDLYTQLVRGLVTTSGGTADASASVVDADQAVNLAATLLALAVGDDGPRLRAEQEEFEREQEMNRTARAARDARRIETDRGGRHDSRKVRDGADDRGYPRDERWDRSDSRKVRDGADDRGYPRGSGPRRPVAGTRYRVAVGHNDGVNPGGIVGALTGEGNITGADVGKIDIFGSFSLVDISAPLDAGQLDRLSRARVAGRALRITIDQGAPEGPRGARPDRPRFHRDDRDDRGARGGSRFGARDERGRDERGSRGFDRDDRGGSRWSRDDRSRGFGRDESGSRGGRDERPTRKPRW